MDTAGKIHKEPIWTNETQYPARLWKGHKLPSKSKQINLPFKQIKNVTYLHQQPRVQATVCTFIARWLASLLHCFLPALFTFASQLPTFPPRICEWTPANRHHRPISATQPNSTQSKETHPSCRSASKRTAPRSEARAAQPSPAVPFCERASSAHALLSWRTMENLFTAWLMALVPIQSAHVYARLCRSTWSQPAVDWVEKAAFSGKHSPLVVGYSVVGDTKYN